MRVTACALLLLLSACATPVPPPVPLRAPVSYGATVANLPLANLRRAVALPWKDEGRCIVAAAANPWPVVVERCFQRIVIENDLPELHYERFLAAAYGYGFTVGVRSAAHRDALLKQDRDLNIFIMSWC